MMNEIELREKTATFSLSYENIMKVNDRTNVPMLREVWFGLSSHVMLLAVSLHDLMHVHVMETCLCPHAYTRTTLRMDI